VYRPQPAPAVLQAKTAAPRPGPQPPVKTPTAPPVYRPQQAAGTAQPKAGIARQPSPQSKPATAKAQPPSHLNNNSSQRVAQMYRRIPGNRVFTQAPPTTTQQPYAYLGVNAHFSNQVGNDKSNRFLVKSKAANVQHSTRVPLRVSDDYQMAIEDTDLHGRQPKTFFATQAVINNGNQGLTRVNSTLGIRAATPAQALTVVDKNGLKHHQVRVEAYVRATTNTLTTGWQNCNQFVQDVTGSFYDYLKPVLSGQSPQGAPRWTFLRSGHYALGQYFAEQIGNESNEHNLGMTTTTKKDFNEAIFSGNPNENFNRIGRYYAEALQNDQAPDLVRRLGINEKASPRPGDAFVIHTLAGEDEKGNIYDVRRAQLFKPKWPYHWAGVVAESGTDRVTLENYARHDPDQKPDQKYDPRWYFQMYGQRKPGQSFHEANVASGEYANPITLAVRNKKRQPPPLTPWQTVGSYASIAARLAILGALAYYTQGME
ncbi:MAG TPA: hypothetical protein VJT74_01990, partial [Pyrinomonadaceae bacterium]|nr:hypothetical protein [Pyrinomonadaceae bacterium]